MLDPTGDISYFAQTTYRNKRQVFGIRQADRLSHMYVIGKTGVGKSTLLENLIWQDTVAGRGVAVLDPHGELIDHVKQVIPDRRRQDLIDFNVPDPANRVTFNPLQHVSAPRRGLAAGGMLDAFKKLWADSWGPRLEHLLRNAIFALLEQQDATLFDILRLFEDREYRSDAIRHVSNSQVRRFWLEEFPKYPPRLQAEAIAPVQNKVGAFLADPVLQRILGNKQSSLLLRPVLDEGKILLVNLAKGRIGEDTSSLLGSLLVSRINLAALSRAEVTESERPPFFAYLDEFQSFTSQAFVTMLSELRKYRVGMVLAHQYLGQLDPAVYEAIVGNVGTLVAFRLGNTDAEVLAQEFYPTFKQSDFANLANRHIYLRMMIDGTASRPFSAETLDPMARGASPLSVQTP
ncbi:MAG: hypothetical protein AMXMBFR82_06780 [Candidatus Hydrogenedentota bacterium]